MSGSRAAPAAETKPRRVSAARCSRTSTTVGRAAGTVEPLARAVSSWASISTSTTPTTTSYVVSARSARTASRSRSNVAWSRTTATGCPSVTCTARATSTSTAASTQSARRSGTEAYSLCPSASFCRASSRETTGVLGRAQHLQRDRPALVDQGRVPGDRLPVALLLEGGRQVAERPAGQAAALDGGGSRGDGAAY